MPQPARAKPECHSTETKCGGKELERALQRHVLRSGQPRLLLRRWITSSLELQSGRREGGGGGTWVWSSLEAHSTMPALAMPTLRTWQHLHSPVVAPTLSRRQAARLGDRHGQKRKRQIWGDAAGAGPLELPLHSCIE